MFDGPYGFSQAQIPSQSVIVTELMIAPSVLSVTINTGWCIHSHRLFQWDDSSESAGMDSE